MKPGKPPGDSSVSPYLTGAVLLAVTLLTYWKTFNYPFIQDDWFIVDAIRRTGPPEFLRDSLTNTGATFYRPMGMVCFTIEYALFGLNPLGFHCISFLLHFGSSLLVAYIAYTLTSDRIMSWMCAFIYATAVTVHLDTLMWMVGIFDVGGALFFLLAIALFLRGRLAYSAIAYCAALLMKESTVVLPLILLTISVARLNERTLANVRRAAVSLTAHLILMVIYLALRLPQSAGSPEAVATGYDLHFFGPHILSNAASYGSWLAESIAPVVANHRPLWIFVLGVGVIFFAGWKNYKNRPLLLLLAGWVVIGILPALVLKNHVFRYYLIYSLPAFCLLISFGVRTLLSSVISGTSASNRTIMVIKALNVVLSTFYVFGLDRQGFDAPTIEGSNNLMRKGKIVSMTEQFLTTEGSSLPQGATLLFDWLPIVSFGGRIGPSIWCRDSSITVYEVKYVDGVMRPRDPFHPEHEPEFPSPDKGYYMRFKGVKLEMKKFSDL